MLRGKWTPDKTILGSALRYEGNGPQIKPILGSAMRYEKRVFEGPKAVILQKKLFIFSLQGRGYVL